MLEALFIIAIIWSIISFIDIIFQTCSFCPYIKGLEALGITIKPLYFNCYITCFNKYLRKVGCFKPRLQSKWFDCGILISCLCIIPAILLLIVSAINLLVTPTEFELQDKLTLVPVVPGINIPLSHLPYFFIVLFLSSIIHEFGHAAAASREKVSILGCGFFIVAVMPAAYVALHTEQMKQLSTWQKLRILCAGVWHNIILAIFAYLLLSSMTFFMSPLYRIDGGISIIDVKQNSGVSGPAGFFSGDQITSLNDCEVEDEKSWYQCLHRIADNPQLGYCVAKEFISKENTAVEVTEDGDCCKDSLTSVCFKQISYKGSKPVCLPVRPMLGKLKSCQVYYECEDLDKFDCIVPILQHDMERLIEAKRKGNIPVLFFGSISEFASSVTVSQWTSNFKSVPVNFVNIYEKFLKYLLAYSIALALLNLIPCPGLDGAYLCDALVHSLLQKSIPKLFYRRILVQILKTFGAGLIIFNIVASLYKLKLS